MIAEYGNLFSEYWKHFHGVHMSVTDCLVHFVTSFKAIMSWFPAGRWVNTHCYWLRCARRRFPTWPRVPAWHRSSSCVTTVHSTHTVTTPCIASPRRTHTATCGSGRLQGMLGKLAVRTSWGVRLTRRPDWEVHRIRRPALGSRSHQCRWVDQGILSLHCTQQL